MRGPLMAVVASLAVIIPVEAGAQSEQPSSGPAEGVQGQSEAAERRGPADLCQELLAFVQGPEEKRAAEDDSPPQAATAVEAPSQDKPAPQPEGGNDASQEASGMSGPIAPSGAGTPGPQGGAEDEPAGQEEAATPASHEAGAPTSAEAKQVPGPSAGTAAPPPTTDPDAAQVEKAQAAAQTGDIGQCRAVAQELRRAGITMPPPLLALAALDPKFFGSGQ